MGWDGLGELVVDAGISGEINVRGFLKGEKKTELRDLGIL